jgi:hypothetical protein
MFDGAAESGIEGVGKGKGPGEKKRRVDELRWKLNEHILSSSVI